MAKTDEEEWATNVYLSAIQEDEIRNLAWRMALAMREEDDPMLNPSDQVTAQKYLKKCLITRSMAEVAALTPADIAGLLARGTLGSARYRAGQVIATGRARGTRGRDR